MADPTPLKVAERPVQQKVLTLAEEVLARVKSGQTVALAVVEVLPAGDVAIQTAHEGRYHYLNSGAARLAAHLATEPGDG